MTSAVEFKNVDIVFGERAAEGLKLLDQGASRSEILEKTGAVLGCAGASLAVKEGEISVLMKQWIAQGRIKWKETVVEDLDNAPKAFLDIFAGANAGKMLVKLADA